MAVSRLVRIVAALLGCIALRPASAEPSLRICLQADDPPLSSRRGDAAGGFDVALAGLVAARLDRPLAIQWFVTRDDADSNPVTEANALLSDGRCALVANYPLVSDKLGRPRARTSKLPPFDGAVPEDRRRWIALGELVPSRAYRFDAITVALAGVRAQASVRSLHDLADLRTGVVNHGLPDLIAMSYRNGELAQRLVHVGGSDALFAQLESGRLDAALVDLRELDAWHLAHPATQIVGSGYAHSVGFNIGFVGLATQAALLRQVDAVVADLQADDSLPKLAQAASMTFLPPRPPDIRSAVTMSALGGD